MASFAPLTVTRDWRFQVRQVLANGLQLTVEPMEVSSDTGTSALLIPRKVYGQLMKIWDMPEGSGLVLLLNLSI
jgi:hypothetical protein